MTASLDAAGVTTSQSGFGPARNLVCRECGSTTSLGASYVCMDCFGPLEIGYDFGTVTHADIETGPQSMWRYAPLLPVPADIASRRNLAPGMTKLVKADNLAKALGMRTLWVKDDSGNPTHSFKDRVVAVALSAAQQLGFTTVGCASTGNLAGAVAAGAARAGLASCVIAPSNLEAGKLVTAAVYGGTLIAVDGNYDDVNRLCSEVAADLGWGFVNVNLRPYYAEGSKTVGYEVAEQLGWRLPRQLVSPVASGSLMTKVDKAFGELVKLGLVEQTPASVFGAQAAATSCSRYVRTPSPSRSRSAARPTARTRSTSHGAPAVRSPMSATRRSSRASSSWRPPRASSARPQAASPSRR
jgi:threonine synthase